MLTCCKWRRIVSHPRGNCCRDTSFDHDTVTTQTHLGIGTWRTVKAVYCSCQHQTSVSKHSIVCPRAAFNHSSSTRDILRAMNSEDQLATSSLTTGHQVSINEHKRDEPFGSIVCGTGGGAHFKAALDLMK